MERLTWAPQDEWRDVRWEELHPTGEPPAPRCSHTATRIGDLLVVFGGGRHVAGEGWVHHNDARALDLERLEWRVLDAGSPPAPPSAALGASEDEPDAPDAPDAPDERRPAPRRGHSACAWEEEGAVVVFGGEGSANKWHDDVWLLRPATATWERLRFPENAARPLARRGHSALVSGGVLYVCGGWTDRSPLFVAHNDVWRCDLRAPRWEALPDVPFVAFTLPWTAAGDELVFVGAKDADAVSQHLAVLRPATGQLRRVARPMHAPWTPPVFASCAALADHALIFGGLGPGDVNTQRLVALDLRSGHVTLLPHEPAPPERNSASLTRVGAQLLLFGGGRHPAPYFNDLWRLSLGLVPRAPPAPPLPHQLGAFVAGAFGDPAFSDVTFVQGEQRLPLSKLVLAARSPLFAAMFRSGMREAARHADVPIEGAPFDAFAAMARFIYTGRAALGPDNATALLLCAQLYDVPDLRRLCEDYVVAHLADADTYAELLLFAAEHHLHALFERLVLTASLAWPAHWPLPAAFPAPLLLRVRQLRRQALALPAPHVTHPPVPFTT